MGFNSALEVAISLSNHGNPIYVVNPSQLEDLDPDSKYTIIISKIVIQADREAILAKLSELNMNIVLVMEKEEHIPSCNIDDLSILFQQLNTEIDIVKKQMSCIQAEIGMIEDYLKTGEFAKDCSGLLSHRVSIEKQLEKAKGKFAVFNYYFQIAQMLLHEMDGKDNIDTGEGNTIDIKNNIYTGDSTFIAGCSDITSSAGCIPKH